MNSAVEQCAANIAPWILEQCDKVREEREAEGYILSDWEYEKVLKYSESKRKMNGKEPEYLILLMWDEIRDKCFRDAINAYSIGIMEARVLA